MNTQTVQFKDIGAVSQRESELIKLAYKQGYLQGRQDGVNGIHMSSRVIESVAFLEGAESLHCE
ncbi:hypothetical protein [Pseudoalteromonas luteoviolacea]|uniref:Uncharacterized protein n=1 Tax=Pseudoalteromonas luteoviolacea H33 TaxID=1365251 RepID=A0A167F9N1_9GAMM|nr:hypothetical protein [Pseudoalteromonas luteoviolacea]KZN51943.1 hypothetical protein N476_01055 [Pseudoalteromonas luteoviolacea H33]KZN78659.1 hypothetical protein N477_07530 [Pseudoalteromonas luteoviolacea H33-S]MBQ4876023.1 hypothetical protein [Pseudoalteromonas luteoviolacea]MBQ4905658.1 hypothetical protein [Pseudoalteromonas luteoviolacea]